MPENLFAKAGTVKVPEKKKTKERTKPQHLIDGLETYAAFMAVMTSLNALASLYEGKVKSQASSIFIEEGCTIKRRPENIRGIEGQASASLELRKRTSAAKLTPEVIALFEHHGLPYETQEQGVQAYIFNPKYIEDQSMLEKISNALSKIPGLPEDLIQLQESKKTQNVSEATVEALFKLPAELVEQLMPLVVTLACKPKMEVEDLQVAMDLVNKTFGQNIKNLPEIEAKVAADKEAKKTTKKAA